ncbi:hypothetical protein [Sinorhizobium meliloti]|uniref:hypothetical protein n=1 Tax=Rhizobium meliloti TaxID=382 RepID=UPI0012971E52|nr:hypothetical protein [Sinorhizobium meliloti]MDW9491727.1 hypothetical protein [Sinorhizobium meliloti]MQV02993.1 hypothetical protein [Sinorhizobium meliloti]
MSDLSTLTNYKLAQLIDRLLPPRDASITAVYNTCDRNDIPFNAILTSLAEDDPVKVEYRRAYLELEAARNEAIFRIGPISATTLIQDVLRRSPRYRRQKVAA